MDPNKNPKPQDKPLDSAEPKPDISDTWLEDMKGDLEDYMEEQGSHLRY